jgi:hypothetical protein
LEQSVPTTQQLYQLIQERYGFELPKEYREMHEQGWFAFDDAHNRMGPNYLWTNDMEWLQPLQILRHDFPEYCKSGFVPFAMTAGGDHWCWYPAFADGGVAPVALCPHDSIMGEIYAPHLYGAAYRQALEFTLNMEDDEEDESRAPIKDWLDRLAPRWPRSWRDQLQEISVRPLQDQHFGKLVWKALLSKEEYKSIVHRDLCFPRLGEEFKWMVKIGE